MKRAGSRNPQGRRQRQARLWWWRHCGVVSASNYFHSLTGLCNRYTSMFGLGRW